MPSTPVRIPSRILFVLVAFLLNSSVPVLGQAKSDVVDVRYSPGETFILNDGDFTQLTRGLHYFPESAFLSKGGHAETRRVDSTGRALIHISIESPRALCDRSCDGILWG